MVSLSLCVIKKAAGLAPARVLRSRCHSNDSDAYPPALNPNAQGSVKRLSLTKARGRADSCYVDVWWFLALLLLT